MTLFYLIFLLKILSPATVTLGVVAESLSCVRLFSAMDCSTLGFTVFHCLPEPHVYCVYSTINIVILVNYLILCHHLLILPSIFPSIRVISNELAICIRWAMYWSFSISPSNEYSGLISFRIDWFDLFAVQGTLKSLLQHHSSKASNWGWGL